MGTDGQVKRIEDVLTIDASTAGKAIEVRSYFLAQGDLQLVSLVLQKVP
jgi:hypothetical protein